MAGVLFPDFARAIGGGMALRQQQQQADMMDEERAAKKAAGALVPQALGGDKEALGKIGTLHPDTAMKIAPLLERLDASQRAKAKESAEYITSTGMAILNAPPEQQPQLYAKVRADAAAQGRDVSTWPTSYDPGWVKFNVDKAMPFAEHFKRSGEGVTFAPPAGGGGGPAPASGGGVNSNNIGNVRPVGGGPSAGFQQPATLDDGIRLAVNNVKAYPAKFNGGQPMTLVQIGERWAPRGDGANDPRQWALNVASIGGLDPNKPLDMNDPMTAAAFARGVHGAEHGANKVLPPERYAQAITGGAQPPGIAQGSDMPAADGSGTPLPPAQQPLAPLKGLQIPPNARVALQGGVPIVKDGNVLYLDANGGWGAAPLPTRAAPRERQAPAGYDFLPEGGLAPIPGGPADPKTAQALADAKRRADEKATPATTVKGMQENLTAIKKIDRALAALDDPKAKGSVGGIGGTVGAWMPGGSEFLNWVDKDGADVRSLIADIGSLKIHDRSGAAVTAAETPRLKPFVPSVGDSPDVIKTKLNNFRVEYDGMLRDSLEFYSEQNGFKPYTPALNYLSSRDQLQAPAATTPPPAGVSTPAPAPQQQPAPQTPRGADRGKLLFDARDAISKGADPAKVRERLKAMGIEEAP